jgi:nicotinamidase/pyrazinamidase
MRLEIADTDLLLVVDVQNDFCPGGRLAVPQGDEVVAPVNRLGERFRHVVLTQDWHPSGHRSFASANPGRQPFETVAFVYGPQVLWPDHCVQGTPGAQLHPELQLPRAELVLRKGWATGATSIPIPPSTRTTTRLRRGSPATCASAAWPGCSSSA